jgi:hypothetical protein
MTWTPRDTVRNVAPAHGWEVDGHDALNRNWYLARDEHRAAVRFSDNGRITTLVLDGDWITRDKSALLLAYLMQKPTAAEASK